MTRRWYLGLSSGSGLGGVDAALVRVEGAGMDMALRLEHALQYPYGKDVRELLVRLGGEPALGARQLGVLHRVLGEAFAAAARSVLEQSPQAGAQALATGL